MCHVASTGPNKLSVAWVFQPVVLVVSLARQGTVYLPGHKRTLAIFWSWRSSSMGCWCQTHKLSPNVSLFGRELHEFEGFFTSEELTFRPIEFHAFDVASKYLLVTWQFGGQSSFQVLCSWFIPPFDNPMVEMIDDSRWFVLNSINNCETIKR